jgi:cadmium resistance protein CadD (predicted permease)
LTDLIGLFGIGIAAFIASNIDDTFILILLFATPSLLARNVIIGQYLGIVLLVIISSTAALIALAIPEFAIGLMGIIPIIMGTKRLLELREKPKGREQNAKKSYLSSLAVTAITVSNGGDDIAVFTPLFAKYNGVFEFTVLVTLLMIMTGIWCLVTYYFLKHTFMASRVNSLSKFVSPFALIVIGAYIILDTFYFQF